MEKKICLVFTFLFFIVLSSAMEYNWLLNNGVSLGTSERITKNFIFPGKNEVILKVTDGLLTASRDITFYVVDETRPYCVEGSNWLVNDENSILIPSEDNCNNTNGYGGRIYCCPPGKECIIGDDNIGYCSENINLFITSCGGYTDSVSCENDRYNIAEYGIEQVVGNENFCGSIINVTESSGLVSVSGCGCIWDDTNDICMATWDVTSSNMDGDPECKGSCHVTTTNVIGDCSVDDFKIEYLESVWVSEIEGNCASSSNCEVGSSQAKIPCGGVVTLNFFDWIGVVISVIVIILIYFYFNKRKKKSRKS